MCVLKKKKSKRNKDSHTKNFNRQNFNFINYSNNQNLSINYNTPRTNYTNLQGVFFITTFTLFLYFFLPLTYNVISQEFSYDILLDVSNLIDTSTDYTQDSSVFSDFGTKDLVSLRSTLSKIKLLGYCL
jgi:hypothetical protein